MSDRPRQYVNGVVVPARIAHLLEQHLDLGALRIRSRGQDNEWDDTLLALHWAAGMYAVSLERSPPTVSRETAASSESREFGTDEAAARLALSPRRVQQLAKAGDLVGEQRSRRWIFTAAAVRDYERRRAR